MKASSISPGARTQHVFGLVAIIWFNSAVSAGEALFFYMKRHVYQNILVNIFKKVIRENTNSR